MMKNNVAVFVLSYKRQDYLIQMIDSLLQQSDQNFDLIVSENSGSPEIANFLRTKYADKLTVLEKKALPSLVHINSVITEGVGKYQYFCMLHDDDTVQPDFVKTCVKALNDNADLVAVSSNSNVLNAEGLQQARLLNPNLKTNQLITSKELLASGYINRNIGITGFPTYFYRSAKVKSHRIDSNSGGKHADAAFLITLLNEGPILQLANPLYNYRMHGLNDSASIAVRDTLSLCGFLLKNTKGLTLPVSIFALKTLVKKAKQSLS